MNETQVNALIAVEDMPAVAPMGPVGNDIFMNKDSFEQAWRVASAFAKSTMVPVMFQGKPENCFLAFYMAKNLDMEPMMLMQSSYIVHGKFGLEGKAIIALINKRGPYPAGLKFNCTKDGVTCSGTRANGDIDMLTLTYDQVKAMGWDKNPLWKSMPEQMACYRSATMLGRRHCPEVLMNMNEANELKEVYGDSVTVLPRNASSLNAELDIKPQAVTIDVVNEKPE